MASLSRNKRQSGFRFRERENNNSGSVANLNCLAADIRSHEDLDRAVTTVENF